MTPKELVEQEKKKLKQAVKDAVTEFVKNTGIDIDNIEVFKINVREHPVSIALTIHLSQMQ